MHPTVPALVPFLVWTTDLRAEIIEAITARGAAERYSDDRHSGTVFVTRATGEEHHRALFQGGTALLALDCEAIELGPDITDDQTDTRVPYDDLRGSMRVDSDGWLTRF